MACVDKSILYLFLLASSFAREFHKQDFSRLRIHGKAPRDAMAVTCSAPVASICENSSRIGYKKPLRNDKNIEWPWNKSEATVETKQYLFPVCYWHFGGSPPAFFIPFGQQPGNVLVRELDAIFRRKFCEIGIGEELNAPPNVNSCLVVWSPQIFPSRRPGLTRRTLAGRELSAPQYSD